MAFDRLILAAIFLAVVIGGFTAIEAALAADGKSRIVVAPGPPQPVMIPPPEFIPKPPAPLQGLPPSRIEPLPPLVIYTTPLVVVPLPPQSAQGTRK